jgi:hypothetical protein
MVPRDVQYNNLTVGGVLATGKLTYSELKLASLTTNIIASGPYTLFKKAFTTDELTLPGPGPNNVNYTITVDTTNSKLGDRLNLFFVTPFPTTTNFLNLQFPGNNVYISEAGNPETNSYGILGTNSRFLLTFVYTGNQFINTDDNF